MIFYVFFALPWSLRLICALLLQPAFSWNIIFSSVFCVICFFAFIFRYYRGTHGVIVVYDVQSAESFVNVKRWLHEIEQNCDSVNRILGKYYG